MTATEAHMTATTHRAITVLAARLVIGALVLAALIVMGVGITQARRPAGLSVDSRP
jgi:hypothetical protein